MRAAIEPRRVFFWREKRNIWCGIISPCPAPPRPRGGPQARRRASADRVAGAGGARRRAFRAGLGAMQPPKGAGISEKKPLFFSRCFFGEFFWHASDFFHLAAIAHTRRVVPRAGSGASCSNRGSLRRLSLVLEGGSWGYFMEMICKSLARRAAMTKKTKNCRRPRRPFLCVCFFTRSLSCGGWRLHNGARARARATLPRGGRRRPLPAAATAARAVRRLGLGRRPLRRSTPAQAY